jgi:DHA1 family tetracycline resistance protein-like MFS transporter
MAEKKPLDRRLLTILMIVFVQLVGASMVLPILPLYAQRRFSMSPEIITLLVSSFFAAQFLAGPTIGRLSDQYGRVPVLIVSQIGTVISFLMLAFAQSIPILFAARIFDGITGGNIVVAQAYITDITPREERTRALGLVLAAFGIGFIVGPALGGVLSALFGDQVPFLFAAAAAAITVLLTRLTLTETVSPEQRTANRSKTRMTLNMRDVVTNLPLVYVLMVGFAAQFGFGLLQATFSLYGDAVLFNAYTNTSTGIADFTLINRVYSPAQVNLGIGLLLATIGLGQFFTQILLLPRLLKVANDSMIVIIGAVVRAASMYIYAIITSPFLGPIGAVFFAVGTGLMMPPMQSLATKTVDDSVRGAALGWYQSSVSLSTICATALSGTLFVISPALPYWAGGTIFLAVIVPMVFLWRQEQRSALSPPEAMPQPSGD